jgi:hypothetical protein
MCPSWLSSVTQLCVSPLERGHDEAWVGRALRPLRFGDDRPLRANVVHFSIQAITWAAARRP